MTADHLPPSPPVRAERWRRGAKRFAVVAGVVLACVVLLCCCGGAYIAYDAHRAPGEEHEMEAFTNDLCQHLLVGDTEAVYAALSASARERYSVQGLASGLAARAPVTGCEVVRATYLFLLAAYVLIEDGHGEHTFDLVWEAGEWKVESDILHDLDSPPRHVSHGHGGFDE